MKIKIKHTSRIERYDSRFPSLSAFLLSADAVATDEERLEENGVGEVTASLPFRVYYRTEEGRPCAVTYEKGYLAVKRGFSEMRFEKGRTTSFLYQTGYGEIETEVYTDALSLTEKEGKWLLSITYYARMGDMVQKNSMRFIITPTA